MTRSRIVLLAGTGLVLLAVAAFLLMVRNLDGVVRSAIENSASAATGTAVRVNSVAISLRDGHGRISGLTIANPPGFSGRPLIAVDAIEIRLDPATLTGEVPVIEEIRIGTASCSYEVNAAGENNLHVVQKQVRRQHKATAETATSRARTEDPARRFRIRRLIVADGVVVLDLGQFGAGRGEARIPGMTMNDLGGEQGGTAEELAVSIIENFGKNLVASVGGGALRQLGDSLNETLRKAQGR